MSDIGRRPVGRPETSLSSKLDANSMPITESGCWMWTGRMDKDGYGITSYKCRSIRAHRASWIVNKGELPAGMCVCHKCDTPGCINPEHLFIGTIAENNMDRDRKGRCRKGSTRFSESDILEIRRLGGEGVSYSGIGRQFDTSPVTARNIVLKITWASI